MIREFRFRAWDGVKMYSPWIKNGAIYRNLHDLMEEDRAINDNLMQFTGLRDCKRTEKFPEGQEIFEGDVVKFTRRYGGDDNAEHIGVIKYVPTMFYIETTRLGVSRELWSPLLKGWSDIRAIEILGNIYEHPHLLGDKQ